MLPIGSQAPQLYGYDELGSLVLFPALERWSYILFNPVFMRYGCRECQTSLLHERYAELRDQGCVVVCATYDPPEVNQRRNAPHVWRIPIVQVNHYQAWKWNTLREPKDSWYLYTPLSVGYLIDPTGVIQKGYKNPDPRNHADELLYDLQHSAVVTA